MNLAFSGAACIPRTPGPGKNAGVFIPRLGAYIWVGHLTWLVEGHASPKRSVCTES